MMTHLGVVTLLPDSTPHLTFDLVAIVAYPWHEQWLEPNRHKLFVGRNIIRGIQRGLKRKLHWDCYLLFFQWDDRVGVKCIILCGTEKKKEEGKQYQRSPCKLSMSIPLLPGCFSSLSLSLSLSLSHTRTSQSPTFPLCKLQPELRPPPIMARICHQPTNHGCPGCLSPCRAVEADLRWSFSVEACS